MRLLLQRRQKCGEYASEEVSLTIWVARIDMKHLEAFGMGTRFHPASCMGIVGLVLAGIADYAKCI